MKAVIFDIDGTLYLRSEPYLRTYHTMFGTIEGINDSELFKVSRRWSDVEFYRCKRGEITVDEMNINRTVHTFREFGVEITREQGAAFQKMYEEFQDQISLIDGMRRTMEYLKEKGIFMGIITNGGSVHQRDKYRALKLEDLIPPENVMASDDIGIHKPDPEIFRQYAAKYDLDPAECWFIGDDPTSDIQGSHNGGWHNVWIVREDPGYPQEDASKSVPADHVLYDDDDLPALMKRIIEG